MSWMRASGIEGMVRDRTGVIRIVDGIAEGDELEIGILPSNEWMHGIDLKSAGS